MQDTTSRPLPHGMTVTPFGWPERDQSFLAYCSILTVRDDYLRAFEQQLGVRLSNFAEFTEEERLALRGKFLDWIATNFWNVDPSNPR